MKNCVKAAIEQAYVSFPKGNFDLLLTLEGGVYLQGVFSEEISDACVAIKVEGSTHLTFVNIDRVLFATYEQERK